jgi:membrane-associated progesterone receptor component
MPVYLAVRGRIFDVTSGRNFYGPGGPYQNFAGRDASRGLAFGSFDEDMLTKDLEGPLDKLEDLGAEELEALRGWEERFEEKYLVVGKLVAVGEEGSESTQRMKPDAIWEKDGTDVRWMYDGIHDGEKILGHGRVEVSFL